MTTDLASAVARLARQYPQVPVETVRSLVDDACGTVAKMLGKPDVDTAIDLAQLRLDIRTRRVA